MGCPSGGLGPSLDTHCIRGLEEQAGKGPQKFLGPEAGILCRPRSRELWAEGSCTGIKGGAPASALTGCVPWGTSLHVLEPHTPHL